MIILRRELRPVIYRLSIKIMVHLPLTVKKGRVKSMKKKNKYTYLFKLYPPVITKDQFYRICNIKVPPIVKTRILISSEHLVQAA